MIKRIKKCVSKNIMMPLLLMTSPAITLASPLNDMSGNPLTDTIQKAIDMVTSGLGSAILVFAIMGVGFAWLAKGVISKTPAVTAIVSGSVIFGASWLAKFFGFV